MFARLADTVARHWTLVVLGWLFAVVVTRFVAPAWQDIINDGDFAYLPPGLPSVIGEQWMSEAFPWQRGKSQIVVAIAREGTPMTNDDVQVGYDVVRRMKNIFGAARLAEAQRLADEESALRQAGRTAAADEVRDRRLATLQQADEALHDALELDTKLADYWDERVAADTALAPLRPPRLAEIYHNRALLARWQGDLDAARTEATNAVQLDPSLQNAGDEVRPAAAAQLPLVDVWSWRDSFFGSKLVSQDNHVRLVVLQLSNEFMAVDNIQVLETIEAELQPVRESLLQHDAAGPGDRAVRFGGRGCRPAAIRGCQHPEYRGRDRRDGDPVPGTRVPVAAAGGRSARHDPGVAAGLHGPGGVAHAIVVRAGFQLVDAQGVLDDEDLHRGHPVWRRHGFLPVPDCTIQGGTARRTRSHERP